MLRMAALPSMTEVLSRSVFWVTLLGFILVGISVLGVAGLQGQISRLLQFLPEIVVAILILFLGLIIANFLSRAALGHALRNYFRDLSAIPQADYFGHRAILARQKPSNRWRAS